MINVVVSKKDAMTPMEREKAIQSGADYDRIPIVPFIEQWKCRRYHVAREDIRRSLRYLPTSSDGSEKLIVASADDTARRELREILMPDYTVIEAMGRLADEELSRSQSYGGDGILLLDKKGIE